MMMMMMMMMMMKPFCHTWFNVILGIGNQTDHNELFNMASLPEDKYLYEFPDYDNLDNVTLGVNYVKCKGKVLPLEEIQRNQVNVQ